MEQIVNSLSSEFDEMSNKLKRYTFMQKGYNQSFLTHPVKDKYQLSSDDENSIKHAIQNSSNINQNGKISRKLPIGANYSILNSRYLLGHPLGKGCYGRVKSVYDLHNKIFRAVKIIKKDNPKIKIELKKELYFMKKYDPNSLIDIIETSYKHYIIMNPAKYDLASYVKKHAQTYNIAKLLILSIKITKELKKIHENDILHLDLKLNNILVMKDDIKIADFGSSEQCLHNQNTKFTPFTNNKCSHLPNELFKSNTSIEYYIDSSADIYSLGYTILHLFKLTNIIVTELISNLTTRMRDKNPKNRPKIDQILKELNNIYAKLDQSEITTLTRPPTTTETELSFSRVSTSLSRQLNQTDKNKLDKQSYSDTISMSNSADAIPISNSADAISMARSTDAISMAHSTDAISMAHSADAISMARSADAKSDNSVAKTAHSEQTSASQKSKRLVMKL